MSRAGTSLEVVPSHAVALLPRDGDAARGFADRMHPRA